MWNVIRAQLYQLKRDKMVWGIFLFALVLNGIFSFTNMTDMDEELSGSLTVASMGSMYCMAGMIVILIVVANVMGKDFIDKTLNYEILSGHSRREVYFGRFITAVLIGPVISFLVIAAVPLVMTLIFGWGTTIELEGVLVRYALIFFTLVQIACELALITILTKNPYVTYLAGFILGYIQMMFFTVRTEFPDWFAERDFSMLSIWHCMDLLSFQDMTTFLYSSEVEASAIWLSIGISLILGGIIILAGYLYFRRDDLN
ncbi:MAG: ABC transporter permease [Bacteroides sp.]|nr:ABC transporter permease [Bacteroides sp.]MCM1549928.1 ABC transporter permease [Clostridium sp.]